MDNCTREKATPLRVVAVERRRRRSRGSTQCSNCGHYLGARQPSGHTLRHAVVDGDGGWVAVALWCGGTYRLDPRDEHIGWDSKKREERGALVTQLARFMGAGCRRGRTSRRRRWGPRCGRFPNSSGRSTATPRRWRRVSAIRNCTRERCTSPRTGRSWASPKASRATTRATMCPTPAPRRCGSGPCGTTGGRTCAPRPCRRGTRPPCGPRGGCRWTTRASSRSSARSRGCATGASPTAASRRCPYCAPSPWRCSAGTAACPRSSASRRG